MRNIKLFIYATLILIPLAFFYPACGHGAMKPQVDAGWAHAAAIMSNGTLWTWGANNYGQLGNGTTASSGSPERIGSDVDWGSISAGYAHTVALKANGILWTWGWNAYGQLGNGTWNNSALWTSPQQLGTDTNWNSIMAGRQHTIALKSDGSVWSWGINAAGELGIGNNTGPETCYSSQKCSTIPLQVTLGNIVRVAVGRRHTLALRADGTIWSWGYNNYGQIGNGTAANSHAPVQIPAIANVVSIAAGEYHSLALTSDGKLLAWGRNNFGQLGNGTTADSWSPVPVKAQSGEDFSDVVAIAAGEGHSLAVKSDGTLWAWGHNDEGQFGDGTTTNSSYPKQIGNGTNWIYIAGGGDYIGTDASYAHTIALKSDGTLWTWGSDNYGQLGNDASGGNPIKTIGLGDNWATADGGGSHTVSVKPNGTVKSWGDNSYGQLGDGTNTQRLSPQPISIYNAVAAATGLNHSAVLISNGTINTFGDNQYGQLGIGSTGGVSNSPQSIGLYNAASIKAGDNHTLALISNGTVWSWGRNNYGQLGNGTTDDANAPAQASGIINASEITAGDSHSAALISNGTVWTWGRNNYGQLGDGTTNNATTPVQASGIINAASIASGGSHTAALLSNGTVWTWGDNQYGQLGKPAISNSTTPVQVDIYNATSIAAGKEHTVALISNGTLWAWGNNNYGQIGNGTTGGYHDTPVRIGSANNWVWIEAGDYHTLARKSNGELWAWGRNDSGQLGRGDTALQNSPAIVGSTNSPPTANDGSLSLAEDAGATSGSLSASDPDGDPLTFSIVSNGSKGTASITNSTTGAYTYTPTANLNGADSFTFKAYDGSLYSGNATISVTITAVNDTPSFTKGGNQSVSEDAGAQSVDSWATSISPGPSDESSQTLTFNVSNDNNALFSAQPAVASNGTLTYTPASNANGSATVTLSLQDSGGTANGGDDTADSQTFTITVNAVNDVPTNISLSSSSVAENQASGTAVGTLSATDVDAGDTHTFTLVSGSGDTDNGSFTISVTSLKTAAEFDYETKNSYSILVRTTDSGSLTYEKVFAISITNVNDAPVANAQSVSTNEDTAKNITLTGSDVDGDALTYSVLAGPLHGTLSGMAPNLTYTPALNYNGADSFTFKANDTQADSNTATVTINITETAPPVTTASPAGGIYNATQSVTLSCSDSESGCDKTYYCTGAGCGPTTVYSGAIGISNSTVLRFYSKDNAGNSETAKQEAYTIGDIGCTDGGNIQCLVRLDGGGDDNNLSDGKPKLAIEYEFRLSVIDKSGVKPQATLYVSQRGSPSDSQFYSHEMICGGTNYAGGDTCTYRTKLGPASALKFRFKVITGDGKEMTYPPSGYLSGPVVRLLSGYNILGVPRDLTDFALGSSDAFGSSWAYGWNGTQYERVTTSIPVETGEGYFVYGESETLPDLTHNDLQASTYTVLLKPGWNLISNPYGGNVKLSQIKVKKGAETPVTWETAVSAPNEWLTPAVYYYTGSDWGGLYASENVDAAYGQDPYIVQWVGYWLYLGASDDDYSLVFQKPSAQ